MMKVIQHYYRHLFLEMANKISQKYLNSLLLKGINFGMCFINGLQKSVEYKNHVDMLS